MCALARLLSQAQPSESTRMFAQLFIYPYSDQDLLSNLNTSSELIELISQQRTATPPLVTWAQRNQVVFLTICLEDCKSPDIRIENNAVIFKGVGGTEKKPHEVTIDLYKEVDPEKSKTFVRDRNIEILLKKKEEGPFWPHLTKNKQKYHWLKVDFNKWRDEDDSDEEAAGGPDDLEEMMRQMGGLGGMSPGGDMKPSFDDLEAESDSDDEGMPDLE